MYKYKFIQNKLINSFVFTVHAQLIQFKKLYFKNIDTKIVPKIKMNTFTIHSRASTGISCNYLTAF